MIIRTEYANFGRPEAKLAPMKMTQKDVEDWVKMKKEQR